MRPPRTRRRLDRRVHRIRDLPCGGLRIFLELELERCRVACRNCGAVKRERLDVLADNSRYTKRFAFYVGRRCRSAPIKNIAEDCISSETPVCRPVVKVSSPPQPPRLLRRRARSRWPNSRSFQLYARLERFGLTE